MEEDVSHINAEPAAATYDGFGRTPSSSAFFPPSLDSDSIADTIKSFFPIAGPSSSTIGFQSYQAAAATATEHHQPLSIFPPKGNPGAAQDLRLSLQSYQDPMLVQHHQTHASAPTTTSAGHHTPFFSTSGAIATPLPLVYDAAAPTIGWADHNHPRGAMASWIAGGAGGYVFSVPPQPPPLHPALSQSSHVTQRGPLQSSNPSANYAWVEPSSVSGLQEHGGVYSSAFGFTPGSSCFSSFQIPTRAQGEEEQDGSFDKPSSAFSASRR